MGGAKFLIGGKKQDKKIKEQSSDEVVPTYTLHSDPLITKPLEFLTGDKKQNKKLEEQSPEEIVPNYTLHSDPLISSTNVLKKTVSEHDQSEIIEQIPTPDGNLVKTLSIPLPKKRFDNEVDTQPQAGNRKVSTQNRKSIKKNYYQALINNKAQTTTSKTESSKEEKKIPEIMSSSVKNKRPLILSAGSANSGSNLLLGPRLNVQTITNNKAQTTTSKTESSKEEKKIPEIMSSSVKNKRPLILSAGSANSGSNLLLGPRLNVQTITNNKSQTTTSKTESLEDEKKAPGNLDLNEKNTINNVLDKRTKKIKFELNKKINPKSNTKIMRNKNIVISNMNKNNLFIINRDE